MQSTHRLPRHFRSLFFRTTSDRHKVYYIIWRIIRQLYYCNVVHGIKKYLYSPVEYHSSSFRYGLHPTIRRIAIMKYKKIASKRRLSGGFFSEFLKDLLGKYGAHLGLGVKYYVIPILYKYIILWKMSNNLPSSEVSAVAALKSI